MLRTRTVLIAAAAMAAAAPITAANTPAPTPADQVKARVAAYRELGASFKNANDAMRSDPPQTIMIQQSAREIVNAARGQYRLFPAGTGPQPGVKTLAKPEIWTQARAFRRAQDAFARQAAAFQVAARRGDPAAMRAATRALGGTCKACHDSYRTPPP